MKQNKLRARWSKKEKDLLVTYPLGRGTSCDMGYLFGIFNKEFIKEMKDRGYDIMSLRFEIAVDPKGERFEEKFPTLAKELKESERS